MVVWRFRRAKHEKSPGDFVLQNISLGCKKHSKHYGLQRLVTPGNTGVSLDNFKLSLVLYIDTCATQESKVPGTTVRITTASMHYRNSSLIMVHFQRYSRSTLPAHMLTATSVTQKQTGRALPHALIGCRLRRDRDDHTCPEIQHTPLLLRTS